MRALNVLLAFAMSIALALAVLEGGLRLFPAFRPLETVNEFHRELGWAKRPGAVARRTTRELDITLEINSRGLRDDPLATIAKKENTFRVLCLGDSFVLGYTVDRADLFVDLMEGWYRAEQRRVEVLNAGTEGYSTDQEALWFRRYGKEYAPDLVLLFPYENDIYWCREERYTRFPKPRLDAAGRLEARTLTDPGPAPVLLRSAIGNFLDKVVLRRLARPAADHAHRFQPAGREEWVFSEFAPLFHAEPPFLADAVARTRGALAALQADCAGAGARLLMVPIPSESAIQPDEKARFREIGLAGIPDELWSPDKPVELFLDLGQELGIETLDPRAALKAAHALGGEPLYFADEWHFNPHGNRVFATFLVDALNGRRVFPPGHEAIGPGSFPAPAAPGGPPAWLCVFAVLWLLLGGSYAYNYRDEPAHLAALKVGALLLVIFAIVLGGGRLLAAVPPSLAPYLVAGFLVLVLGFVAVKLGRRLATILELLRAFTLRGHWYLMPLVVVLLTVGSLLVVAASSPLIAPFIYTLF
ncbi:MAG: DUF5989 family protein [Planctomycetota bacterium]